MHKIANSTKKFVRQHKEALIVGASLGTVIVMMWKAQTSAFDFMKEKGIYEEYLPGD